MNIRVEEYIRADGSSPFRSWLSSLDVLAGAKVTMALARLSAGNTSRVKWFAGIGEYRIDWGPGYRIYFARFGDSLIMLYGGGIKKRQFGDIDRARQLHVECKARRRSQGHGSEP